jgi:hypothetical protein
MATSAEQDEHDDKDATAASEASEKESGGDEEPTGDEKPAAKAKASRVKDDAEDTDEEEAAPKKAPAKSSKSGAGAKRPAGARGASKGRPVSNQQGSSLGKSMILFVLIIGGLAVGFAMLGREEQQAPPTMKWKVGETTDVEITLVKNDRNELACAAADEIGGKHCAFESNTKPWSKGDLNDDKKLLKPYTTTDRAQFVAAGVWSEPALAADKIPASRFSLKCKFKVEGKLKNMSVRWEQTGQWYPNNEWFAGAVSDCKVVP